MLGHPTQTEADIDATVSLVRRLNPDYRVVSFFQPFPGTPYWKNSDSYGLSEIEPLDRWHFHENPVCRTRHLSKKQLVNWAAKLALERPELESVDPGTDTLQLLSRSIIEHQDLPSVVKESLYMLETCSLGSALDQIQGAARWAREDHSFTLAFRLGSREGVKS